MFGYAGKTLHIDLEEKKIKVKPIKEEFCKKYIGGNGFATRLLFDNTKSNIDPLGEENVLIFAVGPLTGTIAPTSGKYVVQAKSPLTGFIGESVSSGMWGQALKWAGYDAIIIKGKADKTPSDEILKSLVENGSSVNAQKLTEKVQGLSAGEYCHIPLGYYRVAPSGDQKFSPLILSFYKEEQTIHLNARFIDSQAEESQISFQVEAKKLEVMLGDR